MLLQRSFRVVGQRSIEETDREQQRRVRSDRALRTHTCRDMVVPTVLAGLEPREHCCKLDADAVGCLSDKTPGKYRSSTRNLCVAPILVPRVNGISIIVQV